MTNSVSGNVFYVSHGSPMLLAQESEASLFFKGLGKIVGNPRAILMISAHWNTRDPVVSTTLKNDTIYDFGGFPSHLYKIKYNAPGEPAIAKRIKHLLDTAGFKSVTEDPKRGLDHGAWVPMLLMYPKADVPVFQMSIQPHRDAEYHYKLGQALAPLIAEGVAIIGSGSTTHNLRELFLPATPSWALEFEKWLHESLIHGRYKDVVNYLHKAPHATRNHPTSEHFLPLIVALGAAGENCKAKALHRSWEAGSLSMSSYLFTR